jgi:hypothetical protein
LRFTAQRGIDGGIGNRGHQSHPRGPSGQPGLADCRPASLA